jgi:glycosyltransferase involved in cell wall biosynthesis
LSSEYLNVIKNKCESLPLGIDISEFASDEETLFKASEIKVQYDKPIIVFVGKLRYYKGLQFLIKAMQFISAQLFIIGDGVIEDELKKLCTECGVENKVKFCGELDGNDLKAYLYAGDVFCLPSHLRSEAFGVCQIEAMACGLPVVSTSLNTGVPYVNRHKKTGLIVPPANPVELAQAINKILEDDDFRKQLGENAKKHVLENFTHTLMIERIKNVYKKLLEE